MSGRLLRLVLLSALALAGVLAAAASLPRTTSAQVPANTTRVIVRVGGDRTTGTPRAIAPLAGVRFGLFADEPPPESFNDRGFVTAAPLYSCAAPGSSSDGECVIDVPSTQDGGMNRDRRLWVAPISGPDNWFNNLDFQTAPLSPSGSTGDTARQVSRYVFQTPPLRASSTPLVTGNSYTVGGTSYGFMHSPANQGTSTTSATTARRRASGGVWPLSRDNPPHPDRCGLDVALVVDLSSSMVGEVASLKRAMNAFVDALHGSPSRAALVTFSTTTPAVNASVPEEGTLQPVATTAQANAFKQLYSHWTESTASGFTNWDIALQEVARSDFDEVVFLTDGLPTVFGPTGSSAGGSGATRFLEMENAIASANLAKHRGPRILAVGVGAGVTSPTARHNLSAISGPIRYDGTNLVQADFFQEDNFDEVGGLLRNLFLEPCAPSVSVIKQVVPHGAPPGDISQADTPRTPWRFSAQTTPPVMVAPDSALTNEAGGVNFDLSFEADQSPAGATITEEQKTGYTPFPVGGGTGPSGNVLCFHKTRPDEPALPAESVPGQPNAFHISGIALTDAVSCTVYNQAPEPATDLEIQKTASEEVIESGSNITYTLRVINHGPGDARNVIVEEPLRGLTFVPAGSSTGCALVDGAVRCELGDLPANQERVITVVAHVPGRHPTGLVNIATVQTDTPETDYGNNEDDAVIRTPDRQADLAITKRASVTNVAPGYQVMYTLVVTNHGPDDATDVTVTDRMTPELVLLLALPSQGECETDVGLVCRLGRIARGGSAQILVTARVAEGATGTIRNTSHVVGAEEDPNPDNNHDTETIHVRPGLPEQGTANLRVTKTASHPSVARGGTITYHLTVSNLGPDTATHAHLTDTVTVDHDVVSVHPSQGTCHAAPVLTCSLGTIRRNDHATVSVVVRLSDIGAARNNVSVTDAQADSDPINNVAAVGATVQRRPRARPPAPNFTG